MQKIIFSFLALGWLLACQSSDLKEELSYPRIVKNTTQYVDPFIGTGGHGHTFPGATLPFGMVQLSPDTHISGWDASSGYHYTDSTLYGFSHTHLSGTGIGDMGDFLVLPYIGEDEDEPLDYLDKSTEEASVAYYTVQLKQSKIKAELTATLRTGMHRYTFPEGATAKLYLDLAHVLQPNWGHKIISGSLEIIDSTTIRGQRKTTGWAYDHPVYFYTQFSSSFELTKHTEKREDNRIAGESVKAWLSFPELKANEKLLVKTGISPVSLEGAQANLEAENSDWDFNLLKTMGEFAWQKELAKIEIETTNDSIKTNFYTALYHSMLAPMLAQDVNGQYRGMGKQIHQAEDDFTNYTVYSLWDTFRSLHPLMHLINREKSATWAKALLRKYEQGGVLPKWALASNYTGTMVGYPSVAFLADAAAKGIAFDVPKAVEAAVISSTYNEELSSTFAEPRAAYVLPKQLDFIDKNGFIPADSIGQSVSYGLECAYYDWCIAAMATDVGEEEVASRYDNRSQQYKAYFDSNIGFMRGKLANGEWREPFDPYYSDHNVQVSEFVEGNSWQWMWFVPHDVEGYIDLMGGKEAFAAKLDELFSADSEIRGENASADISGLIGQYAHGNEPSHHVAYLYNYVDQPEKAQLRLDQIMRELYTPTPDGISGNEDCGAMSAWYILSAMGFYPVCPGSTAYAIGRPVVDKATIFLENGNMLEIEVKNNSPENKYVGSVELNGELLDQPFFDHDAIQNGGTLVFEMTDEM
ncbi:MAG: GH92 family glycosyl hydrolase [Bacteroidota bacterium]